MPLIVPPVTAIALLACVAIVPNPKFVRAVLAAATSDKLLLGCRNAEVACVDAVPSPNADLASLAFALPVPPLETAMGVATETEGVPS